jgi:flagellar biogenesis protein FliO
MEPEEKKPNGALFGSVVIIIILIIGGIYLFIMKMQEIKDNQNINQNLSTLNQPAK